MAAKAYLVRRSGEVIGAIIPERFNLRIVRVPYHDPDRDGAISGKTYTIALEPAGTAMKVIGDHLPSPYHGYQGSKRHLQCQLAGAVDAWNKAHG